MSAELLQRARAGDRDAFAALVESHRGELQLHCYRMLGSLQDAEDALQETLLAAWVGLEGFEGRSSVRTWLYRIATNRCLNQLRSTSRRALAAGPLPVLRRTHKSWVRRQSSSKWMPSPRPWRTISRA